jgi:uncharacterized MnhB-related membrane protein
MLFLTLILGAVLCAVQSMRARRMINAALWLACASALLSVIFYLSGGREVAVIELSVGAGLVTILFVFAINIAGDTPAEDRSIPPKAVIVGLPLANLILLAWLLKPLASLPSVEGVEPLFSVVMWQGRGLDVLVQIVLIFAGVLGLIGLLAEAKPPLDGSAAELFVARREQDLLALETAALEHENVAEKEPVP